MFLGLSNVHKKVKYKLQDSVFKEDWQKGILSGIIYKVFRKSSYFYLFPFYPHNIILVVNIMQYWKDIRMK